MICFAQDAPIEHQNEFVSNVCNGGECGVLYWDQIVFFSLKHMLPIEHLLSEPIQFRCLMQLCYWW